MKSRLLFKGTTNAMSRRWARKLERACCAFATYIPLVFVYGLTSWAVWVVVSIGSASIKSAWIGTDALGDDGSGCEGENYEEYMLT